jgi:hypothetical protein
MTKAAKRPFPRAWRRQWQQTRQAAKRPFPDMSGAEAVYECAFAAQWLADSKGLIRERWSFADDLGAEWEQPGLYRHRPVALCWDDFFGGGFAGYALNGRAGSPFVALAVGTQLPNMWRARPPLQSPAVGQERAYSSTRALPGIREAVESWEQNKTRLRIGLGWSKPSASRGIRPMDRDV